MPDRREIAQITSYVNLGAAMPKESRIELFRALFGLTEDQGLIKVLLEHVADSSDDESEEERLCLIRFVLNFVAGTLFTQNLTPADLKEDLKRIEFDNPLLMQDAQGNWNDFSGPASGIQISGSNLGALIESDLKNYKYCNLSTFDYETEKDLLWDTYDDWELLFELGLLPQNLEVTDYAYFVWSAYMYPEFLLLAYANPGNVFSSPINYELETRWSRAYDKCGVLLRLIPSGLEEILWFRPRILLLLSSIKISKHFDEFEDHWINLFPVLEYSQLTNDETRRVEVLRDYIAEVENRQSARLDQRLDDIDNGTEVEFTKLLTIASSCLYTDNSQLLEELSKIDDETTRICVMLNPNSKSSLESNNYNLIEEFSEKFDSSTLGKHFNGPGEFIDEISQIASACRDVEFVARLNALKYLD
jgi:hypothetical protein